MDRLLCIKGSKKFVYQCVELVFLALLVFYNMLCNLHLTLMLYNLARLGVLFRINFVKVVYILVLELG